MMSNIGKLIPLLLYNLKDRLQIVNGYNLKKHYFQLSCISLG